MRAWLEIDLAAVSRNYDRIRHHIGPHVGVIAVVKSDAYGHGIETMAALLQKRGIQGFAVISLEEAIQIRKVSKAPVLIMGYLTDQEIEEAIRQGCVLSLYDAELAPLYQQIAARLGRKAVVQLKIESGLNRLGMSSEEALAILENKEIYKNLTVEAAYSHLSTSSNPEENNAQYERFGKFIDEAAAKGFELPLHLANSHALPNFRIGFLNAVRVGLALYGVDEVIPGLEPSLTCKTVVIQRKRVKAGEGISYNKLFRAPRDMDVAVLGLGYAEGLSQALTGKANVLIGGRKTPILGQICMNLCVADVTGIPAQRGSEAVVVGRQGESTIRVVDLANAAGLRHHEILTRFGKTLPRIYLNEDKAAEVGKSSSSAEPVLVS